MSPERYTLFFFIQLVYVGASIWIEARGHSETFSVTGSMQ